ncbi:SDR family oxidoreductase [Methylonatrum kenyense]|uniref:SDR family oxidoreductase n=1 Tax=Methylonatrum kenyense TaxID=455253 RepID=UPI0020BE9796|nr:SDR family oxidoreductase [Methylonatrum kenyense]MCK8517071.1 SDR family oxidoreductase [Methylonatrum kenyense]
MKTLVIGANGQIGRQLCALAARADLPVRAMLRQAEQAPWFSDQGIETVIADLEGDFRHAAEGCSEILFTAGSGPHTGADKTLLIDLLGAIRAMDLADATSMRRFIMVSALRAEDPMQAPEALRPYAAAKHAADRLIRLARTPHLILKPGKLTDEPASGYLTTNPATVGHITISRENVALALREALRRPELRQTEFELLDGDIPVEQLFS